MGRYDRQYNNTPPPPPKMPTSESLESVTMLPYEAKGTSQMCLDQGFRDVEGILDYPDGLTVITKGLHMGRWKGQSHRE